MDLRLGDGVPHAKPVVRRTPHCSWCCNESSGSSSWGRGARKEVDLRCQLEGSPPKLDFGQWWGNAEMSSCHDDLYGRAVLLMHSC